MSSSPTSAPRQETVCNDGIDNDGDTLIDAADADCALPAYFTACTAGQTLYVYRSVNVPRAIPDNNVTGVTSVLRATQAATVQRLAVLFSATHTWDSDLGFYLITPSATSLDISSGNGGSGDNYTSTVLDTTCVPAVTSGTAPFTGCYWPETTFATFTGTAAAGLWSLRVADTTGGDTGNLVSWALVLCATP
jgi:subtilisin-like proprotein convertase family protein